MLKIREVGVQRFVNPEDRKHLHFRTAKSEIQIRGKALLWGPADVISSYQEIGIQEIGRIEGKCISTFETLKS